jgi:acyl transferase domain-containing protein
MRQQFTPLNRPAALVLMQIVYMEMHATSTPLGDPIEAAAVGKGLGAVSTAGQLLAQPSAQMFPADAACCAYLQVPGRRQPLLIGAVKSNLGHLESAAGIAGLIKATLAVYYRTMLPTRFRCALAPFLLPAAKAHCTR